MTKINDTTTYPNTTPATGDHVIGTDVSNTTNDANGETVTFTIGDIKTHVLTGGQVTEAWQWDQPSGFAAMEVKANNTDVTLMRVSDQTLGSSSGDYGFRFIYMGTRSGNDNDLTIWVDNQQGVSAEAWRMHQDGTLVHIEDVSFNDSIFVKEKAAANTDAATYAQIWAKSDTPNTLWFTDDAGNDLQLGGGAIGINAQTGTAYTLAMSDRGKTVTMDNASANTATIPTNASVAFPIGTRIPVVQKGAGATSIAGDTGVTLNGVSAGSGAMSAQYSEASVLKVATDTWIVTGQIGAVA